MFRVGDTVSLRARVVRDQTEDGFRICIVCEGEEDKDMVGIKPEFLTLEKAAIRIGDTVLLPNDAQVYEVVGLYNDWVWLDNGHGSMCSVKAKGIREIRSGAMAKRKL